MPNMWLGCYASRLRGFISQDRGSRALRHFLTSGEVVPALPWVSHLRALVICAALSPIGKASLCSCRSIALGFQIRFLHLLPSAEDEEEVCLEPQQEQQFAALDVSSPKVDKGERQAAAAALLQYMHARKQIPLKDAQAICDNAPSAINCILRKAKASRQNGARGSVEYTVISVEQFLHQEGVNEVEVFFESVGCVLQDYSEFMPSNSKCLVGEEGLIACVAVLEDFGIPRKSIWSLFKRETRLFGSNPSYLASCMRSLEECGVGKEDIPKLIQYCPALLGQNLDEVLRPLFHQMEEMGLEKNPFIGQLLKYNPQRLISTGDEKLQKLISLFSRFWSYRAWKTDHSSANDPGEVCQWKPH
ncbi:hypothetical protein O6H91_Y211400 [Diphasiastrum complanatum]|nr:hypothetical protein O6H91_Y211400 [Diphasiastrum complanatum]